MKTIVFPWLERSYSEGLGLDEQYNQDQVNGFHDWLSDQAGRAEKGFIPYDDVDDLVFEGLTEDDKDSVRERLIANIETMNKNREQKNE